MDLDQPPVVRVSVERGHGLHSTEWPMSIPAVAQLARDGLDLSPFVTFVVGENGSGKSTIVEAVAAAYGLSPEGGSAQGHHSTRASESPLGASLTLRRGLGAPRWGFFLRAETMHGWYTFYEESGRDLPPGRPQGPAYHEMSHGESFLEVGDWGIRRTTWAELELVQHWKAYLEEPGRYLRHVLD